MEENENINIEDNAAALDDIKDISEEDIATHSLVRFVTEKFKRAEDARDNDEDRWLRAYRNYRGIYGADVQFSEAEKSRVFVKITKTKTLAAYSQIVDVLFAGNKFPISIEPTELPEGVSENVHINIEPNPMEDQEKPPELPLEFKDGELPKGYRAGIQLGPLEQKLSQQADNIKEGVGTSPKSVTYSPSLIAAKSMEKKIMDQLEESHGTKHLRSTAFEMALFGTGVMKGPFAIDKEYPNWGEDGEYEAIVKTVPQVSHVSVWNFYPDPDANHMNDAQYVVERHKLSRSQLRNLKKRPFFRDNVIESCIEQGESYQRKEWENDLADYTNDLDVERFEVLEYWGVVDKELLEVNDIPMPKEFKDVDEVHANIWVVNGKLIRAVLNPFKPSHIPYMASPYELNPYSFFGIGIAENMDDTQTLMNGFMRMAVDNAVLSGNLLIEVDETNLVPGQDLSVYPGKIFRRQGGAPGQAIFGTKFPNVSNENMQLFDKARQLSDESTGFPSFAHGQTGVTGVGRTASGISMLMNAASGGIKTVIKNVDDYLLRPLGENLFRFNMQFDFDPKIKGDLEVKARGTESLMANEVRSQRLMQFLGTASNPALAPFAKFQYIIREIAKSMDLDPDKVTNNIDEAMLQAKMMQGMQQPQPEQQGKPQAGADANDTSGSGGGQVGVGQAPTPNEQGFTGNAQGETGAVSPQAAGGQQTATGQLQ